MTEQEIRKAINTVLKLAVQDVKVLNKKEKQSLVFDLVWIKGNLERFDLDI